MPTLDHNQRKFTLLHPVHIDLFGGIVKIIHTNSPMVLRGRAQPILALRWQPGVSDEITEEHYSLEGGWCMDGKPSKYDLWDADLDSIKSMSRVRLNVVGANVNVA